MVIFDSLLYPTDLLNLVGYDQYTIARMIRILHNVSYALCKQVCLRGLYN